MITAITQAMCSAIEGGNLPRQSLVGLRTTATQSSVQAWEAGHRAALPAPRASVKSAYIMLALPVLSAIFLLTAHTGLAPEYLLIPAMRGLIVPTAVMVYAARVADQAARTLGSSTP